MVTRHTRQAIYLQAALDVALLCLAFLLAFQLRAWVDVSWLRPLPDLSFSSHFWLLSLAVPLHLALTRQVAPHSLRGLATSFVYLMLLLGTAIFLFQAKTFSRAVFFLFFTFGWSFLAASRVALRIGSPSSRRTARSQRNVLIVGNGEEARALRRKIERNPDFLMRVVRLLPGPEQRSTADGTWTELKQIIEDEVVDDVVFVVPLSQMSSCQKWITCCEEVGVDVHFKVDFFRPLLAKVYPSDLDGTPMLTLSTTPHDPRALLFKRALDIVVSCLALVALAPLLALTALAIRVSSPGPVLFRQERVGLHGRPFRLLKFRSMYLDAEKRKSALSSRNEQTGPVFKMRRDPRITPLGRFLRRWSVDELPQLWNVLCGDMSLVGPRPPLESEVRQYERWQRRRLSMKPGLTCLWQIEGRSEIPFEDWMRLDLEYIDNWSLTLDVKILLRTVPAVVSARGAS